MNYPSISVLTVSLNSGKYLERAIQSVLKQKYENWEHIVVDGGSTDQTLGILEKYDHLVWISEPDRGQSDAMNKAFRMSKGDIILYLNADDEVADRTFAYVADFFRDNPKQSVLIGDLIQSFTDGTLVVKTPSLYLLQILISFTPCNFPLNPVSYYYRREVQSSIGEFPLDNHLSMDYWFLLNCYYYYELHKTNKILGLYHVTDFNKSLMSAEESLSSLEETKKSFLLGKPKLNFFLYINFT